MMSSKRWQRVLVAVGFWWIIPACLWGQGVNPGAAVVATLTPAQVMAQAQQLFGEPEHFGAAADMLEKAGIATPLEDVGGANLLVAAARIQVYTGELARARRNMQEAGWRALGNGKLLLAANAYADAALIAQRQNDEPAAREYVRIVKLLAQWPKVSAAERRQILSRIG